MEVLRAAGADRSPQALEGYEARVQAPAFTPDGDTLFSGDRDRSVR